MSLRLWLPLRGNLDNQGLDKCTCTGTNVTVDNSGKIGKCYSFNGTSSMIKTTENLFLQGDPEFSVCFWVYANAWTNDYAAILEQDNNQSAKTMSITCYNGRMALDIWNYRYQMATGVPAQQWHHVAVTKTPGALNTTTKIYIDGILNTNCSGTANIPNFTQKPLIIGRLNAATNRWFNGKLNDIRIYDHALSAKEVEEIAKGLVLHYKLDSNLQQLNNCYNYPTFNTSTATGGWNHWGSSGHGGSYGQTTDRNFIFNKNQTYAHWITNTASSTGYYILYQSPSFSGGYRSLQVILKQEDSAPIQGSGIAPGWNADIGNHPRNTWDSIIYLGNGFYLCKCEGFQQDGSNDLVSIEIPAKYGKKLYISEAYLENDRIVCSDIFNQENLTVVYDCSGYKNNGTPVGTLAAIKPSPRYELATNFPASGNNYISIGNQIYNARDEMTINLWAKADDWTSSSKGVPFSSVQSGGIGWQASSANYVFYCGTGASSNTYKSINVTVNNLSAGWHMLSATYDGLTLKVYTDGELKGTTTANSSKVPIWYNNNSGMFVSGESAGSLTAPNGSIFRGAISDVRVYATALTADQIKELYNTSMAIDSNGNIMAREIQE